jgi:hypothetical protein
VVRVAVVAALLVAAPASAAPALAHLQYAREAGAERCLDEAALRAQVAARLGREPFNDRALTTVSVTLSKAPRGLKARIELVDATGEVTGARELSSRRPDCAELGAAVELAVSIAIDPLSFAGGPSPAEVAPTPERAPVPVSVSATPPPAPPAFEPKKLRYRLGAGALAALGSSPGVAAGFTIQGGLRGRRWSANLEVRGDLPSAQAAAGGYVSTALYTASAIPCFHAALFAGCGILALGGQVSSGSAFPVSRQVSTFYAAGGVRAALEVGLTRKLELHIRADLLAAITRTTLLADEVVVFRTPPVSGAFHLAMLGYFQ